MQNLKSSVGGYTTVSPPEARQLAGFPNMTTSFVGFCEFCDKKKNN